MRDHPYQTPLIGSFVNKFCFYRMVTLKPRVTDSLRIWLNFIDRKMHKQQNSTGQLWTRVKNFQPTERQTVERIQVSGGMASWILNEDLSLSSLTRKQENWEF